MSYILEALRRADSERERGTVPTVHAHPVPAEMAAEGAGARRVRPWLWVAAAILLLVTGAGLAQWWTRPEREPPARPTQMAPAANTPVAAATRPPSQPEQLEQRPAALRPELVVREPPRPLVSVAPATRKPPAPVAAAPRAEVPVADRPVPLASALPEDIRRQLPALTAGGAMYSEAPANRMLIINGQLFHEGDKVAPDLVLEQIKLRGAVLSFKGQRFKISY